MISNDWGIEMVDEGDMDTVDITVNTLKLILLIHFRKEQSKLLKRNKNKIWMIWWKNFKICEFIGLYIIEDYVLNII